MDMGRWPGFRGAVRPWRGLQGRSIWLCCSPGTTHKTWGQAPSRSLYLWGVHTQFPFGTSDLRVPCHATLSAAHTLLRASVPCLSDCGRGTQTPVGSLEGQ